MFLFSKIEDAIVLPVPHRGNSLKAPENTWAAFQSAFDEGCQAIEIDFSITSDDKFAVIHDHRLERTTNGEGIVENASWEYIKTLDAGSWFDKKFTGEKVPLLDDVLDWAITKNIGLVVEVKHRHYPQKLAPALTNLLKKHPKAIDHILLLAFDHHLINQVKKAIPKLRLECVTLARYNRQLDAILASNASSVSIEFPNFHMDDGLAYKKAGLTTRLFLPEDPIHNDPLKQLSWTYGEDARAKITTWMQAGVIDMLCYDDAAYLKDFITSAGMKWR